MERGCIRRSGGRAGEARVVGEEGEGGGEGECGKIGDFVDFKAYVEARQEGCNTEICQYLHPVGTVRLSPINRWVDLDERESPPRQPLKHHRTRPTF